MSTNSASSCGQRNDYHPFPSSNYNNENRSSDDSSLIGHLLQTSRRGESPRLPLFPIIRGGRLLRNDGGATTSRVHVDHRTIADILDEALDLVREDNVFFLPGADDDNDSSISSSSSVGVQQKE